MNRSPRGFCFIVAVLLVSLNPVLAEEATNVLTVADYLDLERVSDPQISPDGSKIISTSDQGEALIWDATTGDELRKLSGHRNSVRSLSFTPNGKRIISGSYDATVRIWDAETGKRVDVLLGYEGPIFSVAFSPNGKHVACAGGGENAIIWTPRLE